jgi:superfamily II DNA or RNA helicase
VATFEAAYRNIERIGNRFDLLIVDEVHHFGTGLRDETLEMAIADARLGLSATPPRTKTAVTRLAELIGPLELAWMRPINELHDSIARPRAFALQRSRMSRGITDP